MKNGSENGPKIFVTTALGFPISMNCSNRNCREPLAKGSFVISIPIERDFSTLKLKREECPKCGTENMVAMLFETRSAADVFCSRPTSTKILLGESEYEKYSDSAH